MEVFLEDKLTRERDYKMMEKNITKSFMNFFIINSTIHNYNNLNSSY